ncbi:uncharacterized protein LOC143288275 [Babylonia areolata]|uniref:uncharacterized protein LOC143288275 n=1 Tax=Babylonia areolata TaxID=304850 RepID=UPI003FD1DC16
MIAGQRSIMENSKMVAVNSLRQGYKHSHTIYPLPAQPSRSVGSVDNFRFLCGSQDSLKKDPAVFRSAKPDNVSETDLRAIKYQLGIKCIVDCRSKHEYQKSHKATRLDAEYQLYTVKLPFGRNFRHDEPVTVEPVTTVETGPSDYRHYLIDFFTAYYILKIICRLPWYIKLYSIFVYLYDSFCCTGYKNFIRLIAQTVINKTGLVGQYKDMIDFSQRSICAALKLLSRKDQLPALVNCAHGKDRTGIVSALVLYCQGKSIEEIVADYALSEEGLMPAKDKLHRDIVEYLQLSEEFTTAKPETMELMFQYIVDRYGSVDNYLDHIGFGVSEQKMLRANLQGPATAEI